MAKKKVAIQAGLIVATAVLRYFDMARFDPYVHNAFLTLLGISINYAVFRLALEEVIAKKIKEASSRYSFRRAMVIVHGVSLAAIALVIWVENPQALLLSSGILAAGAAFALQDFFKSFVAGISILVNRPYRVGDRIEIDSKKGDVIDIGILHTLVLEIGEWVNGDQPTGRLMTIPNSRIFLGIMTNYTKDHPYIWDEICLPITYDSNWEKAVSDIRSFVNEETLDETTRADKSISGLGEKYFVTKKESAPNIFVKLTDNWITLRIRYVTRVSERARVHDRLGRLILKYIAKNDDIRIASETLSVNLGNPSLVPGKLADEGKS